MRRRVAGVCRQFIGIHENKSSCVCVSVHRGFGGFFRFLGRTDKREARAVRLEERASCTMCRWLVWSSSDPILLSDLLLNPSNSLIHQAFNGGFHPGTTEKNNMGLNADGCGVGWYGHSGAAIFRSTTPAWNNRNLRELAGSIESKTIFAHVRAATPASIVSEENCHPFRYGSMLFQHNGHVEKFPLIRRRLMAALRDDIYDCALRRRSNVDVNGTRLHLPARDATHRSDGAQGWTARRTRRRASR